MREWDMLEMDVLREIGTIAASYGTEALTKLLNRNIKISLPTVLPLTGPGAEKLRLGSDDDNVIIVQCDIVAGLGGRLFLTFDNPSAAKFLRLCYPDYILYEGDVLTELGISALKEVGNIVLSSYVNALSMFLKSSVVPSPPLVMKGSLDQIIRKAVEADDKMYVLLIDAVFEKGEEQIKGRIEFLLTHQDREMIQKSCDNSIQKDNLIVDERGSEFGADEDVLGR